MAFLSCRKQIEIEVLSPEHQSVHDSGDWRYLNLQDHSIIFCSKDFYTSCIFFSHLVSIFYFFVDLVILCFKLFILSTNFLNHSLKFYFINLKLSRVKNKVFHGLLNACVSFMLFLMCKTKFFMPSLKKKNLDQSNSLGKVFQRSSSSIA